jgi:hypothetical protein
MKLKLAALALLTLPVACSTIAERMARPAETDAESRQVLVLGSWHPANPGADLVNTEADDVLTPVRQAELEALVRRPAVFQPTAIMVEADRKRPDLPDTGHMDFAPDDLLSNRSAITQIAYRLAHELGIEPVHGVDTREGEIDFAPFDKVQSFEAAKGIDVTGPMIAQVQAETTEFSEAHKTETISQLLARQNDPAQITAMHTPSNVARSSSPMQRASPARSSIAAGTHAMPRPSARSPQRPGPATA